MIIHTCKTCGQAIQVANEVSDIIANVARHSGISEKNIKGPYRGQMSARARFAVFYLARMRTLKSLPDIGRIVGGRDHTTVIHGLRRAEHLLKTDQAFADMVASCSAVPDGQESFL